MTSNFLVQDIWDHIIDFHRESPRDLQSCSLVCRMMVPRAQRHIFHTLILPNSAIGANPLREILDSSPHLIQYIREIRLGACDADALAPLVQIPWSQLDALWLGHYMRSASAPDLEKLHRLVELPSIRRITFHSDRWRAEHLLSIFAHCPPGLARVDFVGCKIALIPLPPLAPAARRPVIRHLALCDSPTVAGLLLDPACPLDCRTLTYLNSGSNENSDIAALRIQASRTIETLHFESAAPIAFLDIGAFPALRCLKCDDVGSSFSHLLATLAPNNAITRVCVELAGPHVGPEDLQEFETAVLAGRLPALERVDMEVATRSPIFYAIKQANGWAQMEEVLRAQLARLQERGLLFVAFV
ncbi:hypothetical protein FB451DRAFT_720446 [Mycena latifolia]|nr:hypothetical protein FB451DRAFT_720446 [Mycena latifolia]